MSRLTDFTASSAGPTEPGMVPPTGVGRTWPVEARSLLAAVALIIGIGLMTVCRETGSSARKTFEAAPLLVLDPNSAPPAVLEALPGLGPALVGRWVAARSERPFSSLADARRRVRGLGPASLAQIAPYLNFDPGATDAPIQGQTASIARSLPDSIQTADITGERLGRR